MTTTATPTRTRAKRRAVLVLLGIAAALTVLDGAATALWLHLGQTEANPLLAALADTIGVAPAMAVRVVIGLGLLGALAAIVDRSRLAPLGAVLVTGVLLGVGLWHGYGATVVLAGL